MGRERVRPSNNFSIIDDDQWLQLYYYLSMNNPYGRYHDINAVSKHNPKSSSESYRNSLTRRNRQLSETLPARQQSTSFAVASLKSLRLYRHICRFIPYLLKVHELQHRTTPEQAKIFMGNHFRENSQITDVEKIDHLVGLGYEMLYEAEWHLTHTGYLYKYLMSPKGIVRDHGIDHFDDYRAHKFNRAPASSFLKGFYKGNKSHEV